MMMPGMDVDLLEGKEPDPEIMAVVMVVVVVYVVLVDVATRVRPIL
jgi:hypothetical protein